MLHLEHLALLASLHPLVASGASATRKSKPGGPEDRGLSRESETASTLTKHLFQRMLSGQETEIRALHSTSVLEHFRRGILGRKLKVLSIFGGVALARVSPGGRAGLRVTGQHHEAADRFALR